MIKKKDKIALPVPLQRWYADMQAIDRLRDILNDESFRRAVATLKENALPSVSSLSTDPQANSNKAVWLAGYCDFIKDLERLTTVPTNQKPNQIEEWTM